MAERYWIAEGPVEAEGGALSLIAYVDADDEKGRFKTYVEVRIVSPVQQQATCEVEFEVRNPLEVIGAITGATGAYAACVAWRMTRFSMKQASKCYNDSKKKKPDLTRAQRIRDVAECLKSKGKAYKTESGNALLDCIPFKDLFGGDDSDAGSDNSDD